AARRLPNGRSVIGVVLESVGLEEMFKEREGRAVMPALQRIAEESFSSNAFYASGTRSAQALPGLFAGEPAQSAGLPLLREPLPSFDGYPRQLERAGYRTGYFHGGDLSFEQQRIFVQMVGFEQIEELDVLREADPAGWGHPDSVMFDRFREWLDRMEEGEAPYLGVLSTLSTHHPFAIPPGEPRVWKQQDRDVKFDEALAYLDRQLARFYAWYIEVARPQGTYLVLVGDHTAQLGLSRSSAAGEAVRFDVPLIVAGDDPELGHARFRDRLASQHDMPATLAGLTGIPTGRCDQGLDIFSDPWPSRRVVYSLSGRDLSHMYLRTPDALGRWNRETGELEMLTQAAAGASDAKYLLSLSETLFALSRHRLTENNFAPPNLEGSARRASITGERTQRILAHRGNIDGPVPTGSGNRLSSFRAAIDAGFEWIEADLNVTRDEVVVVFHDRTVTDPMGRTLRVEDLSYDALRSLPGYEHVISLDQLFESVGQSANVCLDIKPPFTQDGSRRLVRAMARSLRRAQQDGRASREVMVDGFSLPLIASIAQSCECEVGWDLPNGEPVTTEELDTAATSGMDWVFVHHSQLTSSLVAQAHRRGLRVMVYTVNEPEELNGVVVDGIITDQKRIREQFDP
ncbi:MAG: sulfatase-like hydrolase/transferase, partial [Polyangiales bacterium]